MAKATRALGTKLMKDTQAIGGLTSIGGIEITADEIDVTTLDSDGGYKEFIGGFKDAGEVTIEGFFDAENDGQLAMETSLDEGLAEDYKITFPTKPAAEWAFKAVVTGFKVGDADVDGNIMFGATLRISGKPTLTITPEDTTALSIDPEEATFDKNSSGELYDDVVFEITHNTSGVTLTSVSIGETTLTPTTHYTADGLDVTILKTYLETLEDGNVTITFKTNKGDVNAVITVVDTTTITPEA